MYIYRHLEYDDMIKHDITPFLTNNFVHPGIIQLILSILKLEEKLNDLDGQSEYFKWASQSHFKRLLALKKQYETMRLEYNENSLDLLINALKKEEHHLQKGIKSTLPIFAKIIIKKASDDRIARLRDYIKTKAVTDRLPGINELRDDTDLLLKLIA